MKKIIVLRRVPGDGGTILTYLEWHPIATGRQVPLQPGRLSYYAEATQEETAAINSGAVIEERYQLAILSSATVAQVKAQLEARYNARQAELDAMPNPNQFYGVTWDGTTWSI